MKKVINSVMLVDLLDPTYSCACCSMIARVTGTSLSRLPFPSPFSFSRRLSAYVTAFLSTFPFLYLQKQGFSTLSLSHSSVVPQGGSEVEEVFTQTVLVPKSGLLRSSTLRSSTTIQIMSAINGSILI